VHSVTAAVDGLTVERDTIRGYEYTCLGYDNTISAVNKGASEARIPRFLLHRSFLFRAGLHQRRGVQAHIRFGGVSTAW
jgi:hypothetical protein